MQHEDDSNDWKARWAAQKRQWQLEALDRFAQAEALLAEVEALRALIKLAESQIHPKPPG